MNSGDVSNHLTFRWSGSDETFLDRPTITRCGPVTIGRYGGTTSSKSKKNEDAALVWAAGDGAWVFAALLDSHGSSESADLVLNKVVEIEGEVIQLLDRDEAGVPPLWELSTLVTRHIETEDFRHACAAARGETALLVSAQKGAYVWWLSVGDIIAYLFHPDLAFLGQFALNQRMFYEWVGQVNTFALPVPCYSTGVRQLRAGQNRFLMTTDGLLECGTREMENSRALYDLFASKAGKQSVMNTVGKALDYVQTERGRDSATLIAWDVEVLPSEEIMQPSA